MHKKLHLFLIGIIGLICFSFIAITNAQGYDSTCDEFYVGQRLDGGAVITGISPEKGLLTAKRHSNFLEYYSETDTFYLAHHVNYSEMTCKHALRAYNSEKNILE
jgi:hypothetical protein